MQAGRQLPGHVLHRMYGEVSLAVEQGAFEFLDEQALAADLGQRTIDDLIATRGDRQQTHRQPRMLRQQPRAHVIGLPQRQRTAAGGDPQFLHHSVIQGITQVTQIAADLGQMAAADLQTFVATAQP